MGSEKESSPNIESRRRHILRMPQAVYSASGIGGGTTQGLRTLTLAQSVEGQGRPF